MDGEIVQAKSVREHRSPFRPTTTRGAWLFIAAVALAWLALYLLNGRVWDWIFGLLGLDLSEPAIGAIHYFFYDSGQVLLLLVGMIFVIGLLRTTLRPEVVREYLVGKPLAFALLLAALFGAITPFCSCSSIPLFIGFIAAGIPLSVTLTFLIASPLVNEVAVVMLAQSFGTYVTVVYVVSGLAAAMILGAIFSRFDFTNQVQEFVWSTPAARLQGVDTRPTMADRVTAAREEVSEIVGRIWKWVLFGIAIGAVIHGWVPTEFLATYAGPDNPFAVVLVAVLGVPLYSNAAGVIPIAEALWAKGMATGTVLAFMMATVALSFPEFILLKQVLKTKLIAVFFGSVAATVILLGFFFNLIF